MIGAKPDTGGRRGVLAMFSVAALLGCSPRSDTGASATEGPIDVLLQARSLAGEAPAAWPGFDLARQVLVVNVPDSGPVYAVGEGAGSGEGFQEMEGRPGVFVRHGPPTQGLTGMDTDIRWGPDGRPGTMVPYRDDGTLAFLLHEAFHTHQASLADGGLFPGAGGNTRFPDDDPAALAMLNLEARLLADALAATSDEESRRLARLAIAVRERRCDELLSGECDLERALELREGSARYVEWLLLERAGKLSDPVDSLGTEIIELGDGSGLGRFHFYQTGQAWIRLLARHASGDWRADVERRAPDEVLADAIGPATAEHERIALAEGGRARAARAAATAFLEAAAARRDSIVAAFRNRTGVPIRMRSARGPNRATGDPNARSATVDESGQQVYYVVDLTEARHWYPGENEMTTVVREALRIGGCGGPEFCLTVIAPVAGRTVSVGDTNLPLDRPGQAEGVTRLELPAFEFGSRLARVTVYEDSVSIDAL